MRYLGLDYGSKRIGVAISDEEGKIAFPHDVWLNKNLESVLENLKKLIKDEKIGKVIIGLPVPFSGEENRQMKEVRDFAEKLEKEITLPIVFENEMLTTKEAKTGSTKEKIDAASAAVILQSHLDRDK